MKVVLSLIFAVLTAISLAQDCNNPLLNIMGLNQYYGSTPTIVTGTQNCKKFEGKSSCCPVSVLNSIQTYVNQTTSTVRTQNDIRMKKYLGFHSSLTSFYQALALYKKAYTTLKSVNPVAAVTMASFYTQYEPYFDNMIIGLTSLGTPYAPIQLKRNQCQSEMIKIFAAAKCLACDPYYASKGVSSTGAITFSTAVCARMSVACYQYIEQSVPFSYYFLVKDVLNWLTAVTQQINQILAGGQATLNQALLPSLDITSSDPTDYAVSETTVCSNETVCEFACNNGGLLKQGVGDVVSLILGGTQKSDLFARRRILVSTGAGGGPGLGSFDPAENEAGVIVVLGNSSFVTPSFGLIYSSCTILMAVVCLLIATL
jgi:hypothetical protein